MIDDSLIDTSESGRHLGCDADVLDVAAEGAVEEIPSFVGGLTKNALNSDFSTCDRIFFLSVSSSLDWNGNLLLASSACDVMVNRTLGVCTNE